MMLQSRCIEEKQLENDKPAKKGKWVKQIVKKAKAAKLQRVKEKGQQNNNVQQEKRIQPSLGVELQMKVDKWVAVALENGWFPGKIYEKLLCKYAHYNVII